MKVEEQMDKADDPKHRAKLVKYLNKHRGEEYNVLDCIKVGKVVLHILDRELPGDGPDALKGRKVRGEVDSDRRAQL